MTTFLFPAQRAHVTSAFNIAQLLLVTFTCHLSNSPPVRPTCTPLHPRVTREFDRHRVARSITRAVKATDIEEIALFAGRLIRTYRTGAANIIDTLCGWVSISQDEDSGLLTGTDCIVSRDTHGRDVFHIKILVTGILPTALQVERRVHLEEVVVVVGLTRVLASAHQGASCFSEISDGLIRDTRLAIAFVVWAGCVSAIATVDLIQVISVTDLPRGRGLRSFNSK